MTAWRDLKMAQSFLESAIGQLGDAPSEAALHHDEILEIVQHLSGAVRARLVIALINADGESLAWGAALAAMDGVATPYPEPEEGWDEADTARVRMCARRAQEELRSLGYAGCFIPSRKKQGYAWDWQGKAGKR